MRPISAPSSTAWPPASMATRRVKVRWICWGCVIARDYTPLGGTQKRSLGAGEKIAQGRIKGGRHQIGEDRRLGIHGAAADDGGKNPAQRHGARRDHHEAPPDDEEWLSEKKPAL